MLSLLSLSPDRATSWMPGELGGILAHMLDIPLRDLLADSMSSEIPQEWRGDDANLRRLLVDRDAPDALMHRLKHQFKLDSTSADSPLPAEVATVLYIALIAAGHRAGRSLTSLDLASLRDRAQWAARRRWLDPMLADLFNAVINSPR